MNKHGGYFGEDRDRIIDFSVNVNPLGPSKRLIERLKESLESIVRYPEIDGETSKGLISESLGINSNEIILGNGATELIYLFARTLKCKRVLIVEPTFTEYRRAFEMNGSHIYGYFTQEKNDFNIDVNDLLNLIDKIRPDVVVICNPNNPTGAIVDKGDIEVILKSLKEMNSYLFIDESFIDFVEDKSCKPLINKYPLFILRSMTKFYAIPGLRLGYGLGHRGLISILQNKKEPWTINSLALQAVPVLLKDNEYKEMTLNWYQREKRFLLKELVKLENIDVFSSNSNFFLGKVNKGNGQELKQYLLREKIFIRTCEDFNGLDDKFFRIAVRTREDNLTLINKIKKYSK